MAKHIPLSAFTVVTLFASFLAHQTMSTSVFQVQIPTELFRVEGYPHKEALFGIPNYGGTISEHLIYGGDYVNPWKLCTDQESLDFRNNKPDNVGAFILLVDRGGCSFVSKVRLAQHSGASGVIVVDDKCVCTNPQCKDLDCEGREPIMGDDGSGKDVQIPSFLLERDDGKILKTHLQNQEIIKVEMSWSLPTPDDRVEWSLWTSAHDDTSLPFIDEFKFVIAQLGKQQYFEPMYQLVDGNDYGCTDASLRSCDGLCTNGGRYCMNEPDNSMFGTRITGADVVRETLRQKCIWNEYGGSGSSDEGIGMKWWTYMSNFYNLCYYPSYTDEQCISRAMEDAAIDSAAIRKCMEDSKGTKDNVPNTILDNELASMNYLSVVVIPTLIVNNVTERGELTTNSVLSAICAGYARGSRPAACNCAGLTSFSAISSCISSGNEPFVVPSIDSSKGVSVGGVIIIVIAVICAMSTAGIRVAILRSPKSISTYGSTLYWKRTQAQMQDQECEKSQEMSTFEMEQNGIGDNNQNEYSTPIYPQE